MWYKNHLFRIIRHFIRARLSKNRDTYSRAVSYYSISDSEKQNLKNLGFPSFYIGETDNNKIGVKYWIENKYVLKQTGVSLYIRPLLYDEENLYYIKGSKVYIKNSDGNKELLSITVGDKRYCEMIKHNSCYALRGTKEIFVSEDGIIWKSIYEGKRGIKDSMVFVERGGLMYLLFIEYSTGFEKHKHRILEYSFDTDKIRVVKEFENRTLREYDGESDFARHIHVIQIDHFTNDVYVGTGDFDYEPGIYVSHNKGLSFEKLIGGSQLYRTLSFFFTPNYVFWNTDTPEKQFICRMNRKSREIQLYPLINSALWCSLHLNSEPAFYLMSSNSEGALYDYYNRVYGIVFKNEEPLIYELIKRKSENDYSQLFPLCVINNKIYLYDAQTDITFEYELISKNE